MLQSILFVIAVVSICFLGWRYVREEFAGGGTTDVKFMSRNETAAFLYKDADGYVQNLSPTDLYARNVNDPEAYIDRIVASASSFSSKDKILFTKAAQKADEILENEKNFEGITSIPWVLALTEDNEYEEGLPHTRTNIIFVSSKIDRRPKELVKTLIHEKIHLYQRMYPEKMVQYLQSHGYKQWKQRTGVPRVRANPDLDPWIWIDPSTDKPMVAYYSSDKPSGITDIELKSLGFEHPYEQIAYDVSNRWMSKVKNLEL